MELEKKTFYAALFLSGTPLRLSFFQKMFEPINLSNRLAEYIEEFNKLDIGLYIRYVDKGYQMVTNSDVFDILIEYFGEKTENLSRAALETLAIVAYKQPVTKIEIEELRGVNSSGVIRLLLDRNLIKSIGRKKVPGRPLLYSVSNNFFEYFGLKDISDLPTFREWQDIQQK
jgi:segregation and condensation protein B